MASRMQLQADRQLAAPKKERQTKTKRPEHLLFISSTSIKTTEQLQIYCSNLYMNSTPIYILHLSLHEFHTTNESLRRPNAKPIQPTATLIRQQNPLPRIHHRPSVQTSQPAATDQNSKIPITQTNPSDTVHIRSPSYFACTPNHPSMPHKQPGSIPTTPQCHSTQTSAAYSKDQSTDQCISIINISAPIQL